MPASLPYVPSPGIVDTVIRRIKEAATPARVTTDFVTAVMQLKGGTGAAIPPFLKKLGLLNSDGTPTPLYDRLRNDSTSAIAVAEAVRAGYRPLYQANEYAHKLGDAELKGLILQVTGLEKDNRAADLMYGTFRKLRAHANFDGAASVTVPQVIGTKEESTTPLEDVSGIKPINIAYTINLNLPATTNVEVFNAIFKSLREHLLNE